MAPDLGGSKVSAIEAKQIIVSARLWAPKGRTGASSIKSDNPRPKKSLTIEDFSSSNVSGLKARASSVAKELGSDTARGRIGSLKLSIEGVNTFPEWWSSASPSDKTRVLTDKKHFDKLSGLMHVTLSNLMDECPFRGAVPAPSKEDDEDSANEEPVKPGRKIQKEKAPAGKGGTSTPRK